MKRWSTLVVVGAATAGVIGGILLRSSGVVGPRVHDAPPLPPPITPEGQNGLTPEERGVFYHLSEGGEIFPLDWFLALEVETHAEDGTLQARPFMDTVERYGLLPDPRSAGNRYGLPVGISLGRQKAFGTEMIGLNCTLCHVGQIQYRNRAVRIDGGPNMVLVNKFLLAMAAETEATLTSPRRLVRFWERVRAIRKARRAAAKAGDVDPFAPDETLIRRVIHAFTQNRGLLEAQVAVLRTLPTIAHSLAISVPEGFGRLDAFGIGRDELFGAIPGNSLPADAPVSLPHIWGMAYTGWLQWGANTNSVMERNIGQALGVGALYDAKYNSTVNIENLHRMEDFAYKLQPPAWPDAFPAIDRARAERGRVLFWQHCAPCHEKWESDGLMRTYQLHALDSVRTDPLVAIGFERLVQPSRGDPLPFAYGALDIVTNVKVKAYAERNLDTAAIEALEQRHIRKGPQWDPTFRATLLDSEKWPDSKGRKVYRSKTLVGIWATAPFLHNGSVPTIYDLLKPAADRPVMFPTGQREYDPVKLGLQTDPAKFVLPAGLHPIELDTRIAGNWNSGHEWPWFYPTLDDEKRFAIIEYLKTHNEPFGRAPEAPAAGLAALAGSPGAGATAPLPESNDGSRRGLYGLALLLGAGLGVGLLVRSLSANAARYSATEAADIQSIVQGILTLQAKLAADQDRPLRRGTHAKGRCCRATFEVFDVMHTVPDRALAARLAQGVFANPGTYRATVRFANGNSQVQPDTTGDVRACSFSVELPPGTIGPAAGRQDFSMNNATIFPINDAHAFAALVRVANAPSIFKGFRSLSLADKMAFVRIAVLGGIESRPPKRAYQQTRYWSTVPYCHGATDVIKYSAIPSAANPAQPLDGTPNCLQDEIARHVTQDAHASTFDFALQLLDTKKMRHWGRRREAGYWIENASVEWKERQAPFHVVGRLTLVPGSMFSEEACEAQYIDVTTHSTPSSAPLGSINRARWPAETASRKARLGQS
jgi:hypothetical protein